MGVPLPPGLQPQVQHGGLGYGDLDVLRLLPLGVDGDAVNEGLHDGADVLRLAASHQSQRLRSVQRPRLEVGEKVRPDVGCENGAIAEDAVGVELAMAMLSRGLERGAVPNHTTIRSPISGLLKSRCMMFFASKTAWSGVSLIVRRCACDCRREKTTAADPPGGAEICRLRMSDVEIRPATDAPPHSSGLAMQQVHPVDHPCGTWARPAAQPVDAGGGRHARRESSEIPAGAPP